MAYKLTLIEYDEDIFDGDDMIPDISYRDYVTGVLGQREVTEADRKEAALVEFETRIEDMRSYAKVISSSSSSSSSSLSSSSSESPYKSVFLASNVRGITFSPDGTKFYCVVMISGNTHIYQYSLSTAWDIDTLSFVASKHVTGYGLLYMGGRGLSINSDGTMIYIGLMYSYPDGYIQGHPLSTAWDITSFQSNTQFLWVTGFPKSIRFEEDGDYMYITSVTPTASPYSAVLEYTLVNPFEIGGASQTQLISMESYDTECYGHCFHGDGSKILIMGNNTGVIYYWSLPTAWRLIGETKDAEDFDVDELIGGSQRDIFCNPAGDKIYVVSGDGYLYEFEL